MSFSYKVNRRFRFGRADTDGYEYARPGGTISSSSMDKPEAARLLQRGAISVMVPKEWRNMKWDDMHSLASVISESPVKTKAEAEAAIEGYLGD